MGNHMRIAVVDYQKGNLRSVERGLAGVGANVFVSSDPARIARADALVLPGVGAFADAADTMRELGLMEVVRERIDAGVPFLGICLGMHLMFEEGVEGSPAEDDEESSNNARGLAVLPGVVSAMPRVDAAGASFKVPHVGWNSVHGRLEHGALPAAPAIAGGEAAAGGRHGAADGARKHAPDARAAFGDAPDALPCPLFQGIAPGEHFYFTHSYVSPDTPATVAVTDHSIVFPSAVQFRDVAFGVQFHPEKSSDAGRRLLENFANIAKEA